MKHHQPEWEYLARPWQNGWQLWARPKPQKHTPQPPAWQFVREAPDLAGIWQAPLLLALPARLSLAWACWIPEDNPAQAIESARLLAEANGILPGGAPPEQFWARLLTPPQHNPSLVSAVIFPQDFPLPSASALQALTASPLALSLPPCSLCHWKENSLSVLALTPDQPENSPILWEARLENLSSPEGQGWLEAFLLEAEAEGFLPPALKAWDLTGTADWKLPNGEPAQILPDTLPHGPPPPACLTLSQWLPPAVQTHRAALLRRKKILHLASWAALAALLLTSAVLAWLITLRWELRALRQQVAQAAQQAQPAIQTAKTWQTLAPTFDPQLFPLEKLLMVVESLPGEGIRLTLFDCTENSLRIEGEARNVGLATAYFNALQTHPRASDYSWQMPSPLLQPDNSARFSIEARLLPADSPGS